MLRARWPAAWLDFIDTAVKAGLIDSFAALGFERVEATSYSNPKVVPQFADASALLAALRAARASGTRPPAPMRARWSGRWRTWTPASAPTRSACWSRPASRIRRAT
ncbi:hypothetical protein WJ972_17220 [Achromobacter insuavis]